MEFNKMQKTSFNKRKKIICPYCKTEQKNPEWYTEPILAPVSRGVVVSDRPLKIRFICENCGNTFKREESI